MILIKMTNELAEKDVIEGFELCDSPQWLMWILLSIGVIGLILVTIYLFVGQKGKKKSRKK
jgi:hypothetical protein